MERAAAMTQIRVRRVPAPIEASLRSAGVHPLLARLYAARGVREQRELDYRTNALIPPQQLTRADAAARLLADAIERNERLLIVADYDCDGATACAVGLRALRAFGGQVDFLVPDRFKLGYGLTPELVELLAPLAPDVLITVDNGIASVAGVAAANALGIRTLITDHHLPGRALPAAACIVNPNQPGCRFPSKSIAGVGVVFYVMLALRAEMRARGRYRDAPEPNLAQLLDLVAAGTVADVVRLDYNNRILVEQGLQRIRADRLCAGLRALFAVAGREPRRASTFDLGFAIGPRLNAAGRLADMRVGIECLTTDDPVRALAIAQDLDRLNRERRDIEATMLEAADAHLASVEVGDRASLTLFDPAWHQGVVGILAGRLKDRHHRPTFAFAGADNGELRGSGRSIAGFHLRDCLDLVAKAHPDLLLRFGGHAAAAGVSIRANDFERFAAAFEAVAAKLVDPAVLTHAIETDGSLEPQYLSYEIARMLEASTWGQGFPAPLFADVFDVRAQKIVGERHLRLKLHREGQTVDAVCFNQIEPLPERVRCVYRLGIDEYNGLASLRLALEHWTA
jgi:single-stranded-DNA-specific exonuclease